MLSSIGFFIVPAFKEVTGRIMRGKKAILLVLTMAFAALVLLFTSTCYAQGGYVRGIVTDAATSAPLSGAKVDLMQGSTTISTQTTDGAGEYGFGGLTTGSYIVVASKTGYLFSERVVAVVMGSTTLQNFALAPTGMLAVNVFDAITALPIQGATVEASGGWVGTTDSAGQLLIYGVPLGVHEVFVSKAGYVTQTQQTNENLDALYFWLEPIPQNQVPEVPFSTIVTSLVMALGIAGFVGLPKLRKRLR